MRFKKHLLPLISSRYLRCYQTDYFKFCFCCKKSSPLKISSSVSEEIVADYWSAVFAPSPSNIKWLELKVIINIIFIFIRFKKGKT